MPVIAAIGPAATYALYGTVASVAISGIGLIAQQSAASQAAANAQAVANYQAQVAQQNAQLQYQISTQQAQYAAQAAALNAQSAQSQQQLFLANAQLTEMNAATAKQLYEARAQEQLRSAKDLELQAEARRAETREEARRLREQGEQRIAAMRAKYGSSGVTFEGSPLVVLADAARLIETGVQDAVYIGELEARKHFRAAETERYGAGLTLLESDIVQKNYASQGFEFQANAYGAQLSQLNAENQIMAATYDTHIAAARLKIDQQQADLIRMGGAVQASNIQAESTANLISGIGKMAGTVATGFSPGGAFSGLFKPTGGLKT